MRSASNQTDPRTGMPDPKRAATASAAPRGTEAVTAPIAICPAVLPPDSPLIANWSNLPARITRFERNGVRAGDLRDTQRAALFDFLSAALRREGADLVHKA